MSAKKSIYYTGIKGTVVSMKTYFGTPEYQIKPDESYFVPFICQIDENTYLGDWDNGFYCDPTRKPNQKAILLIDLHMHHYSWVRNDVKRKIDNSSADYGDAIIRAGENIDIDAIIQAVENPSIDINVPFYEDSYLVKCKNIFGIKLNKKLNKCNKVFL